MFGVEDFTSCLAKFEPRSSSVNTLSKLINGSIAQFYIITDAQTENIVHDLGMLVKPLNLSKYPSRSSRKHLSIIIDSLKGVYSKSSKLEVRRHSFMQTNAKQLADKVNSEILAEKVSVMDRLDNSTLSSRLSSMLNDRNIPFSQHQTIVDELIRIIKDNRSNDNDILPIISSAIDNFAKNLPQVLQGHRLTGKEKSIQRKLFNDRNLLLSGASLCGKTQTALYICRQFLEKRKGVAYLVTSSTNEAENFLFANISEDRLVFIEDPFGQYYNDECPTINNKLKIILQHIATRPNRFLVVTANLGIIDRLEASRHLSPWINLSITDPNILISYWKAAAGISDDKIDFFSKTLFDVLENDPKDQLLQFGQLDHILANKHNIANINAETIRHIGNFKVADMYNELLGLDSVSIDFLLRFAICSNGSAGMGITDIEFLLDPDPDYLPGINRKDNNMGTMIIGRGNKEEQKLAIYRVMESLTSDTEDVLQGLIDKGYLQWASSTIRFKHPIYEEASKRLLNNRDNSFRFSKILKIASKGMGSLNEKLILNIIKNMNICLEYLTGNGDSCAKLLQTISIGLKSTFGNVRDHCQIFLVAHYHKLPDILISKVEGIARNRGYHSNDYYWHGDIPYIPAGPHPGIRSGIFDRIMMRTAGAKKWKKLFNGNLYLRPKDADLALENLISKTETQPKRIHYPILSLLPLLRYNEIFIREQAAYLIASSLNDSTFAKYKYLLLEDNVFVKFQILRGLFRSWPYFVVQTNKDQILDLLREFLKDHFVALSSIDLFTQFGAGYGPASFHWDNEIKKTAIPEMWGLWASLMPAFTSSLPEEMHAHTPRLYSTLLGAKVSDDEMRIVIISWLEWLLRHLERKIVWLKEIVSTVINIFHIKFELFESDIRRQYLTRLSKIENGLFQSYLLRLMLDRWTILSQTERLLVVNMMKIKKDLIPICVSAAEFPAELQKNLGISISRDKKAYSEVSVNGNQILMQCLTQLYIYPPTTDLNWAEYSGWNECLVHALGNPALPSFRVAFSIYVLYQVGYERFGEMDWPDDDPIRKAIAAKPEVAAFIFDVLLEDLLENNGSESGLLWEQFFDALNDAQKEEFALKILDVIECVCRWEGNLKCVPDAIAKQYLFPNLKPDRAVYDLLKAGQYGGTAEMISGMFIMLLNRSEIRLSASISRIKDWCTKNAEFSKELLPITEAYFTSYFDKASNQASVHRRAIEKYFNDWYPEWAPKGRGN